MADRLPPIVPFDPESLGVRLADAAGRLGLGRLPEPDLDHLVGVVTRCSALLGDVYTDERLRAILADDPRRMARALAAAPWLAALLPSGVPAPLARVRRLPDEVRGVGDKALFDVALTGLSAVRGVPLGDLGPRAYRLAADVLEALADDARLRELFLAGPAPGPHTIADEAAFLRRCSERFDVYAHLLRMAGDERDDCALGLVVPTARGEILTPAAAPAIPEPPRALPVPARVPPSPHAGGLFDPREMSRAALLSAYERLLLFAALDLPALGAALASAVVDQDEAIGTLLDDFALFSVGTQPLTRPASYFLVGPTGVGKNLLVERLAAELERRFAIDVPLLTIEGPNYTYPSDINELRGATRGFIRSDEPGLLTEFHERAAQAPLSVILVDEVEKAHPQLLRFFLSILDRGTTTDAHGRELSFPGTLVFFTSNIGYQERADSGQPIGFAGQEERDAACRAELSRALRRALPPEFINRVKLVRFRHLPRASAARIVELEFAKIARRYRDVHGIDLLLTAAGREALLDAGYSHDYGARHLAATLQRLCNVEVGKMIRRDESGPARDPAGLLERLRQAREGDGPLDLAALDRAVAESARARVGYARIVVDAEDGQVVHRPSGT